MGKQGNGRFLVSRLARISILDIGNPVVKLILGFIEYSELLLLIIYYSAANKA
jgi:hypothetical protein